MVRCAKDLPLSKSDNTGNVSVHDNSDDKDDKSLVQIKRLTDINLKQKAQIQSLVHKLNDANQQPPQRHDQSVLLQQIVDRLDRLESGARVKNQGSLAASSAVNAAPSRSAAPSPEL